MGGELRCVYFAKWKISTEAVEGWGVEKSVSRKQNAGVPEYILASDQETGSPYCTPESSVLEFRHRSHGRISGPTTADNGPYHRAAPTPLGTCPF